MSVNVPLAVAAAIGLLTVVEMVRRRRLREEFSWLWVVAFASLLALGLAPSARRRLHEWVSTQGDAGAVLVVAVCFLVAVSLDLSIQASRSATRQKNLAQEVALLRQRLDEVDPGGADRRERSA